MLHEALSGLGPLFGKGCSLLDQLLNSPDFRGNERLAPSSPPQKMGSKVSAYSAAWYWTKLTLWSALSFQEISIHFTNLDIPLSFSPTPGRSTNCSMSHVRSTFEAPMPDLELVKWSTQRILSAVVAHLSRIAGDPKAPAEMTIWREA